jgi:hypothetical protein
MKLLPQSEGKERLILTYDERASLNVDLRIALGTLTQDMPMTGALRDLYDTIKLPEPSRNNTPLDDQEKAVLDEMFDALDDCDTCYYYGSAEVYDRLGDHEIARIITPHINTRHILEIEPKETKA